MASNSTDSALQNVPTSFFAQLIELLPKDRLLAHFDKLCPRRSATKFSAWDHFIALLFCHLAGCDSLREIDDGLYSACGKLKHLDARPMKCQPDTFPPNLRTVLHVVAGLLQADAGRQTTKKSIREARLLARFDNHHRLSEPL